MAITDALLTSETVSRKPKISTAERLKIWREKQRQKLPEERAPSLSKEAVAERWRKCKMKKQQKTLFTSKKAVAECSRKPEVSTAEHLKVWRERQRQKLPEERAPSLSKKAVTERWRKCRMKKQEQTLSTLKKAVAERLRKPEISTAERLKIWRERQRQKLPEERAPSLSKEAVAERLRKCRMKKQEQTLFTLKKAVAERSRKPKISTAERLKIWRERQRQKLPEERAPSLSKEAVAERWRKCRMKKQQQTLSTSKKTIVERLRKPKISTAERLKIWRERQRQKLPEERAPSLSKEAVAERWRKCRMKKQQQTLSTSKNAVFVSSSKQRRIENEQQQIDLKIENVNESLSKLCQFQLTKKTFLVSLYKVSIFSPHIVTENESQSQSAGKDKGVYITPDFRESDTEVQESTNENFEGNERKKPEPFLQVILADDNSTDIKSEEKEQSWVLPSIDVKKRKRDRKSCRN